MASKCIPELHDRGLQMHLQTSLTMAFRSITKLVQLRPPSGSSNLLYPGLQVPLWVTGSQSPNASPNSLNHGLQVHLWVTQSGPLTASPNSFDYSLQVHLSVHTIMASQCISKLTQPRSPSESQSSHNNRLQVYLWVPMIVVFRRTSNCSQALCHGGASSP